MANVSSLYNENADIIRKLLFFSLLMFVVPISVFYGMQKFLFKDNEQGLAYSGIAAVLSVNIVISLYVLMAWKEKNPKNRNDNKTY